MRGVLCGLVALLLAVVVLVGAAGCDNGGTPNTELKLPDVPPGGAGSKAPGMKPPGKGPPKRP
jgi:hypothetical protein